jgi:hypothetical protein
VKQVKIYPEYSTRGGSTFFLLESGLSSGTLKAPISEGRACLEVEVLLYQPNCCNFSNKGSAVANIRNEAALSAESMRCVATYWYIGLRSEVKLEKLQQFG